MNVLYCGDRNIESGLIISILSLLKNAKTNLKVYVLTINSKEWNIDGVTDKCIDVLDNKMKLINKENSIKKFDNKNVYIVTKGEVQNIVLKTNILKKNLMHKKCTE